MAGLAIRNQLEPRIEKIERTIEELAENVQTTDECVVEMFCTEEKLGDRVEYLEEEVPLLKVQNVELTKHLNIVIKKVNDLQTWIKEHWQSCKLACDEEFDINEI